MLTAQDIDKSMIATAFGIKHIESLVPYGGGHINDTFLIECIVNCDSCTGEQREALILQRINQKIFPDVDLLMSNIFSVTEFLARQHTKTLHVRPTVDNASFYRADNGDCYRIYDFIGGALTLDRAINTNAFAQAASVLGKFQKQMATFPAETLGDTIPGFHDTSQRFEHLEAAISANKCNRLCEVASEIEFVHDRKSYCMLINEHLGTAELPLRVTHNDTKLNNFLFDAKTKEGLCLIDLDTVMVGSYLYDFGDALRFGASTAAEDEENLDLVHFSFELYEAFANAYLKEMYGVLTPLELELLPVCAMVITFENGLRFLGDYLNGDTYFKITRPKQNLDRARTQFKLVKEMECNIDRLKSVVQNFKP